VRLRRATRDTESMTNRALLRGRRLRTMLVGPVAAAGVVSPRPVAGGYLYVRRSPKLTDKAHPSSSADFAKQGTGDPVFDATLRQGLAVQLGQSPIPEHDVRGARIRKALRLMGQRRRAAHERTSRAYFFFFLKSAWTPAAPRSRPMDSIAGPGQTSTSSVYEPKTARREDSSRRGAGFRAARTKRTLLSILSQLATEVFIDRGREFATPPGFQPASRRPLAEATDESLLRDADEGVIPARRCELVSGPTTGAAPSLISLRHSTSIPIRRLRLHVLGLAYSTLGEISSWAKRATNKAYELRDTRQRPASAFSSPTFTSGQVNEANLEKGSRDVATVGATRIRADGLAPGLNSVASPREGPRQSTEPHDPSVQTRHEALVHPRLLVPPPIPSIWHGVNVYLVALERRLPQALQQAIGLRPTRRDVADPAPFTSRF